MRSTEITVKGGNLCAPRLFPTEEHQSRRERWENGSPVRDKTTCGRAVSPRHIAQRLTMPRHPFAQWKMLANLSLQSFLSSP
jgi:hypothetical protein